MVLKQFIHKISKQNERGGRGTESALVEGGAGVAELSFLWQVSSILVDLCNPI